AAAVTEFPISGRWMRRFGAFVIAAMLLLTLGLIIADVAGSTACLYEGTWQSTRAYSDVLEETAKARVKATGASVTQTLDYSAPQEFADDSAAIAAIG